MLTIQKLLAFCIIILFSAGLFAQQKIYIVPHVGFYVGSYRGVDSINNKQNWIKTKPFLRKDFTIGIKLSYYHKKLSISAGLDAKIFSSGFYRNEDRSSGQWIDVRPTISQGECKSFYIEGRYSVADWNIKMPRFLKSLAEEPYLIVSTIDPFIGIEYNRMGHTFVNDFVESGVSITTSQGSIPGTVFYHSHNREHIAFRGGVDWVFFNNDKRRFILTLMYQFALKDVGYFRYHYKNPAMGVDFFYQTTTRGSGFTIKAAIPIKIASIKK